MFNFTLSGCVGLFFGHEECTSEGSPSGQITGSADAQLGVVSAAKSQLGWDWQPAGAALATYRCLGAEFHLVGSAVGRVSKSDKPSSSFSLAFSTNKGQQVPESFEGGIRDVPIVSVGGEDLSATLTMSLSLAGEEPVELKAIA